jgi:PAS domain S-box-containing protein
VPIPHPQNMPEWIFNALGSASCGITVADAQDPDLPLIYVNTAFEAMTGYSKDEILGQNCRFLQGTDRDQPELAIIGRALKEERETTAVLRNYRKDGTLFWNELRLAPVFGNKGQLTYYIGIQTDVTAQKEAQADLPRRAQPFYECLEAIPFGVLVLDTEGRIFFANKAASLIMGKIFEPGDWIEDFAAYCQATLAGTDEPYPQETMPISRALAGDTISVSDMEIRQGHRVIPLHISASPIHDPQGEVTHAVAIFADISQRKKAEVLAEHTVAELRKSQENLLILLNQFRVGTLMLDADHRVEFVSKSCEQFAGIDRHCAVGQAWDQVLPFEMQSKLQLQQMLDRRPSERYRITLHWEDSDQKSYWVECDVRDDPQNSQRHILLLYDITEIHRLRQAMEESRYGRMLGNSEPMRALFGLIRDVARGDWTVLIEGETGVGKDLVAHSIHAASPRMDGPFIAVNSAGLSEPLLASQLFGHRKGAFTGAVADQEGFFEAAHGGTLFLDEIGDLPLSMQASLLRVLQEKEITRLGETRPRKVDVRILVATHKDLVAESRAGRFREDLLYRLRVARLCVPALRERKGDIPLLVEAFLRSSYHFSSRAQPRFGAEAMQCLMNYDWPGNVRELKACVDYAVIHCKGDRIDCQNLPPEFSGVAAPAVSEPERLLAVGDESERIREALKQTRGNRRQAAKLLGISRATFYRRLTELGIFKDQ